MKRIPELLAPAGNPDSLNAAIRAGADAVYLGFGPFNARRNAQNFTREELREACESAHLRGVSVFCTMNTIVLPHELSSAISYARQARNCGVDALIIQDIGLARLLSKELPDMRLHASTQMTIHSKDGIKAAYALGFSRITYARELSLGEIAELDGFAHGLGLECESFVHGALCICYSGECLMSSMIGGRSANRGLCAQPCRLPYSLEDSRGGSRGKAEGEHLLSPKDLCAAGILDELVGAGIDSLKVEGRMKSAEYVYTVVSTYREMLDRIAGSSEDARFEQTSDERKRLGSVFSRGFTTAYLESERGNDMMSYQRPNNRGQFVGRVKSVDGSKVRVSDEVRLAEGDLLEFWTKKGNVKSKAQLVRSSHGAVEVEIEDASRIRPQDRVFRIRSVDAEFVPDPYEPRIPVSCNVRLEIGSPAKVEFSARLDWVKRIDDRESHSTASVMPPTACASAEGAQVEPARSRPVDAEDVRKHVGRMGNTPFVLDSLESQISEGAGIGFSEIHHLRTEALERLEQEILRIWDELSGKPRKPKASTHADDGQGSDPDGRRERDRKPLVPKSISIDDLRIAVIATNPDCARAAKRAGADEVFVPALNMKRGQAQMGGALLAEPTQAAYPKDAKAAVGPISHDPIQGSREAELSIDAWESVPQGSGVLAESLGTLLHAFESSIVADASGRLPITNRESVDAAISFGASRIWLSPELSLDQIAELIASSTLPARGFGIKVQGSEELMVMEHCPLMAEGPCASDCKGCKRRLSPRALRDRKGYAFPIVVDSLGRAHLYNGVPLDNVPAIPELIEAGVTSFMLDSTLLNAEETAQQTGRLRKALEVFVASGDALHKQGDSTTGHLFRGVQ